jgi:peroxiredoxin
MTTFKKLAFAVVAALVAFAPQAFAGLAIDAKAPDFELPADDGKTYKLSDFAGSTVVLEWYNKDCPFVRKHYDTQNMQDLQKEAAEKGVVWLKVISSAEGKQGYQTADEAAAQLTKEGSHARRILLDKKGTVGRAYDAKTTPQMFIINGDGVLVYAGAIDDNPSANPADARTARNYVREALTALHAGEAIKEKTTIPYGCSVKY